MICLKAEVAMKILFIGCVKSSEIFLQKLVKLHAEIVGVVSKKESSFNADFVDIGYIAQKEGIPLYYTQDVNSYNTICFIENKKPDIIFCFGWSQLLCPQVLSIAPEGAVGFHPAALPQNRGRHPIIWALALGLSTTASTFFKMDSGADTGKILMQDIVSISYDDDAESLYNKIIIKGCEQLEKILKQYAEGNVQLIEQDAATGNTWRKRGKHDGKIDWRMTSFMIYNLVRALSKPYVGAHFVYQGEDYKVWSVKERFLPHIQNIEPGKVLEVYSETHFLVRTGEHALEVLECDAVKLKSGAYLME